MRIAGLPVETDVSAGAWIPAALAASVPAIVAALVPPGFEAYARVFHPAYRYDGDDDVPVSWAEVAAANGRRAHRLMQWVGITGDWDYLTEDSQPPVWDGPPAVGHLPVEVAHRLVPVLAAHTGTPGACWLGCWAGLHLARGALADVPHLALPGGTDVVLVRGTVRDAIRNLAPEPNEQSAGLWWPADRAWCVVTDADLMSSYVGGSAACIAGLLEADGLEVAPAEPADPVGPDADPVNPVPPHR